MRELYVRIYSVYIALNTKERCKLSNNTDMKADPSILALLPPVLGLIPRVAGTPTAGVGECRDQFNMCNESSPQIGDPPAEGEWSKSSIGKTDSSVRCLEGCLFSALSLNDCTEKCDPPSRARSTSTDISSQAIASEATETKLWSEDPEECFSRCTRDIPGVSWTDCEEVCLGLSLSRAADEIRPDPPAAPNPQHGEEEEVCLWRCTRNIPAVSSHTSRKICNGLSRSRAADTGRQLELRSEDTLTKRQSDIESGSEEPVFDLPCLHKCQVAFPAADRGLCDDICAFRGPSQGDDSPASKRDSDDSDKVELACVNACSELQLDQTTTLRCVGACGEYYSTHELDLRVEKREDRSAASF